MRFGGINLDSSIQPVMGQIDHLVTLQKMTADNVANVHTPNYRAKRVDFANFMGAHQNPTMDTPLSARMGASQLPELLATSSDGKVNLQNEFMDMQRNLLYFNMAAKRMNTVITNIKAAAQVGR
jgi:flagellar basal-body rod protein FlgB